MKIFPVVFSLTLLLSFSPVKAQHHEVGNYNYHSGDYSSHTADDSADTNSGPSYGYSPSYNTLPSAPAPVNNQWAPFGMVRSQYDRTAPNYPTYSYPVWNAVQPFSQSTRPVDYGVVYPGSFSYGGSSGYYNPTPAYNYYRPAPTTGYGMTYQYNFR